MCFSGRVVTCSRRRSEQVVVLKAYCKCVRFVIQTSFALLASLAVVVLMTLSSRRLAVIVPPQGVGDPVRFGEPRTRPK
jgi:hypothetical protein